MEYIFTDLPQYVKVNARTDFDNAVVKDGCVLLFSEDGSTLTAKTADGSFVSVGGGGTGGGVDVSGVTATDEQVLEGYRFVTKDGELTEGSIPVYQSADIEPTANMVYIAQGYYEGDKEVTVGTAVAPGTITPGTADIVLAQGSFLVGNVIVKGEPNWKEENIAEGVSMWGKVGTFKGGSGGGGTDVPFPDDPTVYISFQNSTTADTGQAMTVSGSPTLTTLWDVPCAEFHKQSNERIYLTNKITLHGSLTQSLWFYPGGYNGGNCGTLAFINRENSWWYVYPSVDIRSNQKRVLLIGGDAGNSGQGYGYGTLDINAWNHLCIVLDAERQISALYINGERCATSQNYYEEDRNDTYSEHEWEVAAGNNNQSQNGTSCKGHVASYRVYDRVLSDAEIKKIYESDIAPNIPLAEGKFTVTGDEWVAGVYYAEPGTKGAGRRWMQEWDGESEERMGIMFDGTFWIICTFLAMYEETEDGDYVMTGEWEPGYEAYYDPSRQFDENFENLIGEPLGMGVAAPDMAGVWCSAGDPTEGQVTVTYGEYTPPDVTITDDPYKSTYWMRAKSSGTTTNVIVTKLTKQKIGLNGRPTFQNDFSTMAGTWKYGYIADHDGWVLVDALGHDMFRSKNETTEIVGDYVGVGSYAGWTAEVTETQNGE